MEIISERRSRSVRNFAINVLNILPIFYVLISTFLGSASLLVDYVTVLTFIMPIAYMYCMVSASFLSFSSRLFLVYGTR